MKSGRRLALFVVAVLDSRLGVVVLESSWELDWSPLCELASELSNALPVPDGNASRDWTGLIKWEWRKIENGMNCPPGNAAAP